MVGKLKEPEPESHRAKATYLGFLFLIQYTPFMTVQNLVSQLELSNGFGSLGFYLLGVLYISQTLGSTVAVPIYLRLGMKWTFVLGAGNLAMVALCQVIPAERALLIDEGREPKTRFLQILLGEQFTVVILVLGSILSGFGQALLWVAQGQYIGMCATEETKGFYFGYFWSWYMSSQIIGNCIGGFIIKKTSGPAFFAILSCIMFVGILGFVFLQMPPPRQASESPTSFSTDETVGEEIARGAPPASPSFWEEIKATLKVGVSKKMMLLNPEIVWTGTSLAYWSGLLTPIMILQQASSTKSEIEKESSALFAMMAFGVGEVLGAPCCGKVIDYIGSRKTLIVLMGLILFQGAITISSLLKLEYDWLTMVMCFAWGLQDSAVNTHTFQTLAFQFDDKSEEAFGAFLSLQGITVFTAQAIQGALNVESQTALLAYTVAVDMMALGAFSLSTRFPYRHEGKSSEIEFLPMAEESK